MKAPLVLAIDTSCDDTSVAVTRGFEVLSNVVASQTQLHKQYGGVFPTVAKLAHKENILPTTVAALKRAGVEWPDIEKIAVTQGPGLAPSLEVGIKTAQDFAAQYHKPLQPINHIEGHILSVLAVPKNHDFMAPHFPALAVVVSGGHTEFVAVKAIGNYQRLGWTIDDAAGEALDKVGRILDLGYPAGPVMEEFAKLGNDTAFDFPLPMTTSGDYNLSFSGLKTHARNLYERLEAKKLLNKTQIYDFSASFEKAVFRSICYKLNKILEQEQFQEIWLGGGVAANMKLRQLLRTTIKPYGLKLRLPYTKKLCSDNAAMIGIAAQNKKTLTAETQIDRSPRMKLS